MNINRSIKTRDVVFSIFGAVACAIFLFSPLIGFYSFFLVGGLKGFWISAVNLTIAYAAFMGVFYIAVSPFLKPCYLIAIGSLLSCNSGYYAIVVQSIKLSSCVEQAIPAHDVLYLLPLLFWIVYLCFKAKGDAFRQTSLRSIIFKYPFFVVAVVYLLIVPLFSKNLMFVYIIYINYGLLIVLFTAQLYKGGDIFKNISEKRMCRWL